MPERDVELVTNAIRNGETSVGGYIIFPFTYEEFIKREEAFEKAKFFGFFRKGKCLFLALKVQVEENTEVLRFVG